MDRVEGEAQRGDVRLWWERFDSGDGRTLVLHPGAGDTADVFPQSFCKRFVADGWHVVRFDPRDTGRSTRTEDESAYGLDDLADDLWAVADDAGVGRAVLVGYSLGGAVVQSAAARATARTDAVITFGTPARPPETVVHDDAMAFLTTADDIDAPLSLTKEPLWFAGLDEGELEEIDRRMTPGRAPTARSSSRHGFAAMSGPIPTDEELAAVTCPVLVVHSTADQVIPHEQADATARPFPNATVTRLDGIGHIPSDRQWLTVADVLRAFLETSVAVDV